MTRRGWSGRGAMGALCAAGLTVTIGCGDTATSGQGDDGQKQPERLTIGLAPTTVLTQVRVAEQQGYFRREGLTVTVKLLQGGATNVAALQSGAIQLGNGNVLSTIQGATQGLKTPCFGGATTTPDKGNLLPLIASKKSGISSATQLPGRTVAVNATGGASQLMVQSLLKRQGVDYKSVKFVATPIQNFVSALQSGRVDAAVTYEPFSTIAIQNGGKVLAGDLLKEIPGKPVYTCWQASDRWLDEHGEAAAAFLRAVGQANEYMKRDPGTFVKLSVDELKIAPAIAKIMTPPEFTTDMASEDIEQWQDAALEFGIISEKPPLGDVFVPVGEAK